MYIMRDQITEVKTHNITYIISSQNLHDCDRVMFFTGFVKNSNIFGDVSTNNS